MPNEETGELQPKTSARQSRDTSWGPIIAIIIVALIVFLTVNERHNGDDRQTMTSESTFNSTAFLGGVERRNSSSAFRGGKASAVMGGVDLDFRDSIMEGDEAKIEVSAIMGGVDIRVPRTWNVINRVVPILGGVDDHTSPRDAKKRLIIEGTVLMGGLEIKN